MIRQTRLEMWLLWRSWVLPVALLLTAIVATATVVNGAHAVRANHAMLEHTKREYAANGLDFAADLRRPVTVETDGLAPGEASVGNLARYDYDRLAASVSAMSPTSALSETLKGFGLLVLPLVAFMLGLWSATVWRRHGLEKVTLVRAGPVATVAGRQVAVVVASALVVATAVMVDATGRAIARATLSRDLPLGDFAPLTAAPPAHPLAQVGAIVLVILFFGGAGVATGAVVGSFALPALLFLAWDYVLPILVVHDPRNWFAALGHEVFTYSSAFELAQPLPIEPVLAGACALASTILLGGVAQFASSRRNPRAT
ncbi:hypothetical protein [Glaciihabitans sp. dw_435]|uniref:hypothetical protein n=1 Tax=Glaciihabitans sp. dw_435 TaxID=2720081 RepID=UPI001BD2289D|nr:hypothetical protein [Glaciihabitans sp. dw_435]